MEENKKKIISFFFQMRQNIYLYHLTTLKYSRHVGTGKFVDSLDTLIDTFLETYMGRYGRPTTEIKRVIHLLSFNDDQILDEIGFYINYLSKELPTYILPTDTDLLNIRDELLGLFNRNIYLFKLN
jgi:hypothetical protein